MALAKVGTEGRGRKRCVRKNSGTTSLTLVAATIRAMGSPIFLAISPAHKLPKLPLGTLKTTDSPGAMARRRSNCP